MTTKAKRRIPKPFSEMSRAEKVAEAHAAIARLEHPHNRGDRECQKAIQRWQQVLTELSGDFRHVNEQHK